MKQDTPKSMRFTEFQSMGKVHSEWELHNHKNSKLKAPKLQANEVVWAWVGWARKTVTAKLVSTFKKMFGKFSCEIRMSINKKIILALFLSWPTKMQTASSWNWVKLTEDQSFRTYWKNEKNNSCCTQGWVVIPIFSVACRWGNQEGSRGWWIEDLECLMRECKDLWGQHFPVLYPYTDMTDSWFFLPLWATLNQSILCSSFQFIAGKRQHSPTSFRCSNMLLIIAIQQCE